MTQEEWENEYLNYKSIIEEDDFGTFNRAIKSKVPSSSTVLDMAFAHDVLWADTLIQAGYDVSANKDLLFRAVSDVNVPYVKYLLKHGANPNVIVQNGYSTMNRLYKFGVKGPAWDDMVKSLLKNGGDPFPEQYCWTVAEAVFKQGSDELKKYYIDLICEKGLITFANESIRRYHSILDVAKGCVSMDMQEYIIDRFPNTKETELWILQWAIDGIIGVLYVTEMNRRKTSLFVDKQTFLNQVDSILKEVYEKAMTHKVLPNKEELGMAVKAARQKEVGTEYADDYEKYIMCLERFISMH